MSHTSPSRTRVVVLGCMHATGGARETSPIVVPCAGRFDATTILNSFAAGADGVLVLSCPAQECLHRHCEEQPCAASGAETASVARHLLACVGLSPKRIAHRALSRRDDVDQLTFEFKGEIEKLGEWSKTLPERMSAVVPTSSSERFALAFARVQAASSSSPANPIPTKSGDILWLGCGALRMQVTGDTSVSVDAPLKLWQRSGHDRQSVVTSRCCGEPLRQAGEVEAWTMLAENNAELITRSGASRVITACPHCTTTLRKAYRSETRSSAVEFLELSQWARDNLEFIERAPQTALVDCTLESGNSRTVSQAVPLLASSTTVTLFEEPRTAEGQPLAGRSLRKELERLGQEALRRGAEALVLTSPHRASDWRLAGGVGAGWQRGEPLPILDVGQALLERTKETSGARTKNSGLGKDEVEI